MQAYLTKFASQIVGAVPNIIAALLIFVFSLYLAKLLGNLVKRVLLRKNTAFGVTHLLADMLTWTIIVLGVVAALQRFFNVAAFLAGLGIIGFTLGFAMQNVVQNFASGIILLVQQPFKVGDEIQTLEFEGLVLQINIRTTEMQAKDGRIVILPNAEVISHPIVNYTRANRRRVDVILQIAEPADLDKIRQLAQAQVKEVIGSVQFPTPEAVFQNLNQNSVELRVSFWIDVSSVSTAVAKDQALIKLKETFKRYKVKLAAPMAYLEAVK